MNQAKIIWWLGLVAGAVDLYFHWLLFRDVPQYALWIMGYLFASFYAYRVGSIRASSNRP